VKPHSPVLPRLAVFLVCAWLSAPVSAYDTLIRVDQDGNGDFTTIQAAIDATKSFPDQDITILIGPGVYEEKVVVWEWNTRLTLAGSGHDRTVIRWADHFQAIDRGRNSTFHTATLRVDANDFYARDLSVENMAGPVGQAIALSVNADRALFERVDIRGYQDSLYLAGESNRVLFRDCSVEGSVDFIFGGALAVFERCRIHSRASGYVTAASTFEDQAAGLVFLDCQLSAEAGVRDVYLGRPWRNHAQAVFLRSEMGPHIVPAGWHDWGRPEARQSAFFAEFESRGDGAAPESRVDWSHQLTSEQAAEFTLERLFGREGEPPWYQPESESKER
jgi:pectinesterase